MPAAAPLPFPSERPDRTCTPAPLTQRGIGLRALRLDDLPWLRELYASTRNQELAMVPWPDAAKRQFLEQQFGLQHRHYVTHHGDSDFLAIEHRGEPIGRYYLQRIAPEHLLVDISLFPTWRGCGIGTTLIRHSLADAAALGRGMCLHVTHANLAARRLYQRLGFAVVAEQGQHWLMRIAPARAGEAGLS